MVTPKELENKRANEYDMKLLEETIDATLLDDYKTTSYHKVIIKDQIPKEVCQKIAELYMRQGWYYVYYASNNPDIDTTLFVFSTKAEEEFENDNYVKVWKGFEN